MQSEDACFRRLVAGVPGTRRSRFPAGMTRNSGLGFDPDGADAGGIFGVVELEIHGCPAL